MEFQPHNSDVEVIIGVLGNLRKVTVKRGLKIKEVLDQVGFDLQDYTLRGWLRVQAESRTLGVEDVVDSDMTILLLRPIVGRAPEIIREVVQANLSDAGLTDTLIQPAIDSEGDDAFRITILLDPSSTSGTGAAPGKVLDTVLQVQNRLLEEADERFPIVEYATTREIEDSAES